MMTAPHLATAINDIMSFRHALDRSEEGARNNRKK